MRNRAIYALCAIALAAGCKQQQQDAGDGNQLMPSAETRVGGQEPDNPPLAAVDPETAKRLMHDRHENFEKIGDAMKVISRELKTDSPDLPQVRQSADVIATLAPQVPSWFPPGSGPDVGKTEAKAEIWQKPEDFAAKARELNRAAAAFQAATRGNDVAAMRAAQGELGKACKACHDLYREEH